MNVRSEMARFIDGRPLRILEIGCAGGGFRKNITWECEYWGVEPVAAVAKQAEKNLFRVLSGTYEDVSSDLPDAYFNLIVCNDVIEHMPDPWAFLVDIQKKLAPSGQIVGSVPNVRYILNLIDLLIHRDWKYTEAGVLDKTHFRFFTIKSLLRLLIETGFSVERLEPVGPDRYACLKQCFSWAFWLAGTDVLYAQLGFRVVC